MDQPFSQRWAQMVVGRWPWVLIIWVVATILFRLFAPAWKDVAYDGDFEYLPKEMSSVAAGSLLDEAFPGIRSRSQVVLIIGRENNELKPNDDIVGLDLLRRLYHRLGEAYWQRAIDFGYDSGPIDQAGEAGNWLRLAREAFDQSIEIDGQLYERIANELPDIPPTATEPRMAIAYWDRFTLLEQLQQPPEEIATDVEAALRLAPDIPKLVKPIAERDLNCVEIVVGRDVLE